MSAEKNSLRVWMRSVMERNKWSANHWATLAGTSATNISRFLRDAEHIPSTSTIAKLAKVAGSWPVMARSHAAPAFACVTIRGENRRVVSPVSVSDRAFAVRLSADAPLALGFHPGDIVIVEPTVVLEARDGAAVRETIPAMLGSLVCRGALIRV